MPFDGIIFRTTDMLKWGLGLSPPRNLTPAEVDDNFWELLRRLETLETSPPIAVSISNITVVGTQLMFFMSDASTFGPFTLPIATFEFRPDLNPAVSGLLLNELDLISVPGFGLYLVRLSHNFVSPFDPARVIGGNAVYLNVFKEDIFIYDIGWFYPGRPGNGIDVGAAMAGHALVRPVQLPISLVGSKAVLQTAPAAALSFPLYKNNTNIGSVDFAIGATVGTFTFVAAISFAVGDVIRLLRPTAIDANARELSLTLLANKT